MAGWVRWVVGYRAAAPEFKNQGATEAVFVPEAEKALPKKVVIITNSVTAPVLRERKAHV